MLSPGVDSIRWHLPVVTCAERRDRHAERRLVRVDVGLAGGEVGPERGNDEREELRVLEDLARRSVERAQLVDERGVVERVDRRPVAGEVRRSIRRRNEARRHGETETPQRDRRGERDDRSHAMSEEDERDIQAGSERTNERVHHRVQARERSLTQAGAAPRRLDGDDLDVVRKRFGPVAVRAHAAARVGEAEEAHARR